VGSFDLCDGPAPPTFSIPSGTRFPLGSTPVQATRARPGRQPRRMLVPGRRERDADEPDDRPIGRLDRLDAGQPYAVPVHIDSDNSVAPTGNIVVSDGTAQCTIVLPATQCSLTSGTAGNKTITATYAGDPIHGGSETDSSHEVEEGVVCAAPVIVTCAPTQSVDAGAACARRCWTSPRRRSHPPRPVVRRRSRRTWRPGLRPRSAPLRSRSTATNAGGSVGCASSFTVTSSAAPALTLNGLTSSRSSAAPVR
jgi:hypothetical protein